MSEISCQGKKLPSPRIELPTRRVPGLLIQAITRLSEAVWVVSILNKNFRI